MKQEANLDAVRAAADPTPALDAMRRGIRRRWALMAILLGVLLLEWAVRGAGAPVSAVIAIVGLGAFANAAAGQVLSQRSAQGWPLLFSPTADLALVLVAVVFSGTSAAPLLLLLALLPHALDLEPRTAHLLFATSALGYVGAAWWHAALLLKSGVLPAETLAGVAIYTVVGWLLLTGGTRLGNRLRDARHLAHSLGRGDFSTVAPVARNDSLATLFQALARASEYLGTQVGTIRQDLARASTEADVVTERIGTLERVIERGSATLQTAVRELGRQRELAGRSRDRGELLEGTAGTLREQVLQVDEQRRTIRQAAQDAHAVVERAGSGLHLAREAVTSTTLAMRALHERSAQIALTAETLAGVARQTHVLALNAAIEAAQSDTGSDNFAVVADEIHGLAGEAGKTARDAVSLVSGLQNDVEAATQAVAGSLAQLDALVEWTNESSSAFGAMEAAIEALGELMAGVPAATREQERQVEALVATLREAEAALAQALDDGTTVLAAEAPTALAEVQERMRLLWQTLQGAATLAAEFRVRPAARTEAEL